MRATPGQVRTLMLATALDTANKNVAKQNGCLRGVSRAGPGPAAGPPVQRAVRSIEEAQRLKEACRVSRRRGRIGLRRHLRYFFFCGESSRLALR